MKKTSVRSCETDAVAWLGKLVACPSVNPRGGPVDAPPFGEARLHAVLAETLRHWGADVEFQEALPGRNNLIARFQGRNSERCLMLECHSDTVPVDGMTIDPFMPKIDNGRLYGRGACDAKGAMAAMLAALAEVLATDGKPPTAVCFVATCNEEQGATGARKLMASGFRADAAIVGEPTALRIVDAHKGAVRFRLEVAGRAAHSSNPGRGINAISKTASIIRRIDGPLTAELAGKRHPRLGSPLISVGVINGGCLVNTIPDRCVIEIDRRLLPDENEKIAVAQLRRHIEVVASAEPPLRYKLQCTQFYGALESDRQSNFGVMLAEAVRQMAGRVVYEAAPWGSDAGAFHAAGIPVFVYGPGSIKQAHSAGEYVEINSVTTAARVYADLIRRFH